MGGSAHSQAWKLNFHEVDYSILVNVSDGNLTIDIEQVFNQLD
jgi:hypothetical protein